MLLTRFSIKRPLAIIMLVLALVIFGIIAFFNIPVSLVPEVEPPYISVQTSYMGASPRR